MAEKAGQIWEQILTALAEMSMARKISIVITLSLSVLALVVLAQISSHSGYQILFTNLKSDDLSQVATALDKYHVSYQIQSETQSILVPGDKVLETRLKLARDNLPQLGGVGFEIFDQKSFGMTEFEQRLNYQRALQGELVRTINELEEVEDARVHLVIPEESVFSQDRQEPSASVVIKLANGKKISEDTIQSIVHLVSASVAGLNSKDVTVVDTSGQLLSSADGESGAFGGETAGGMRKKRDVEMGYEAKIRGLLEPVVGMGKVQVRVTADLDFTSKETTEEKYDPESVAVRSQRNSKLNETGGGSSEAGGVAGANAQAQSSSSSGKNKNESTEDINYEISKQVQHIVEPTGSLHNMSVAVVVDGSTKIKDDGTTEYVPRTPEELKNYEDIVKSAIGFNDKRGDQLKVMNMAFQNPGDLFAKTEGGAFWEKQSAYSFYLNLAINVVIAVIALLIILFVVRPLISAWNARRLAMAGQGGMALDAGGKPMLDRGKMRGDLQKQALDDPESMVKILRAWLE